MVVEPESLCWVEGRKVAHRDAPTWAETFGKFPALDYVVSDGGQGLQGGLDLARGRRREAGIAVPLEQGLDVFHTLREGRRALRTTWRRASEAMDRADAIGRTLKGRARQGQSLQGHGGAAGAAWKRAEGLWDQALAAEAAWGEVHSALGLFTPRGRLSTRSQARAAIAGALPRLAGPEWAKARRALGRREALTFLDRVEERLAGLSLPPEALEAILSLEGMRHSGGRSEGPAPAAARGLALARTVQLAKADPRGGESQARVRRVLRNAWRASSLVECLNSVARMQQSRHRKMTQGLLDLKRLYWNLRRFRTGQRRGKTPYELLGLGLGGLDWWGLLKLSPEQLRQRLSAPRVAA
jgi:hypothetical protein